MSSAAPKRILLVTRPICPPWDEASKNFAYNLAMNIHAPELELHLLTNGILSGLPNSIKQAPIYDSSSWNFFQKFKSLRYQIKNREKYDIVHYFFTPTPLTSFVIRNFTKSEKTKTIQTIATLREDLFSNNLIRKTFFGDILITYSDFTKNKLAKLGYFNIQKIFPGIDLERFSPAPKNIKLMSDWKISAADFVITYPGEYTRLEATDNIIEMIMNLSSLKGAGGMKFIFACRVKNKKDAEKKEEIREKLARAGVLENIIFTDTYADMEKIYNLSDVIIFPVRNMRGKFDIPLAVIEAMACGKPVVISDLEIFSEFTSDNFSVKIEPGNSGQLSEDVLDLYRNIEKRKMIGLNARKFAETNFDIIKSAEEYRRLYESL